MAAAASPADAKPRILFIARSCDIKGMIAEFVARSDAYFSRSSARQPVPAGMKPFTLRTAWHLRRALRAGRYDLVISCSVADPIWRLDRGWLVNTIKLLKKIVRHSPSLGMDLVPWMLQGTHRPRWRSSTGRTTPSWRARTGGC